MTNPDVDVAVLEVARGGIVKRGLQLLMLAVRW